ncbi:myotubularin-related protein 11, partial [Empidonax traillii]|uniref:myotubularin-related protein 11 n=1 Tax=Empidonax traillii TaxID=164674 RepID=UPI000FFDAB2D
MSGAPGGRRPPFPGLPGERVLEEAAGARQRCGAGSVPGTLLCTNRRLAFLPGQVRREHRQRREYRPIPASLQTHPDPHPGCIYTPSQLHPNPIPAAPQPHPSPTPAHPAWSIVEPPCLPWQLLVAGRPRGRGTVKEGHGTAVEPSPIPTTLPGIAGDAPGQLPAFPALPQGPGSHGFLRSEDEVALTCIRKLVAASSFSKPKVLTATSTLKFIPEELAVFCRDFRLLRFSFPDNGLAPQAFRVANAIAQAREVAAWPGDTEGHDEEDDDEEEDEEEGLGATLLFESLRDWEEELERLGATGWRVSAVNERFDMAPSLPRYLWVPSGLLDHDLKRTFGHFQERRVPRLCWHHPAGGDLLRAGGFHPASEPGSEDVRCLEMLLLGDRGPCVLFDTAELPSPADIQLAHLKLQALCLPGAVAEEKWLSALEGTRWLEHVRTCLRKAMEVASLLAGRRCSVVLQEPSDRDLNCLLASLVQLLGDPHARSLHGFQSLVQREWVAAGHPFPHRLGLLRRDSPRQEAPVFLLFLDCTWQLLRQFPGDFGFTEAFVLALHDSSFSPFLSTFRFSCQRQRGQGGPPRPRSQTYRPVGGWQDPSKGSGGHRGGPSSCPFPPVWAWGLRHTREQRQRFRNPAGPPAPAEPPTPGR